MNNKREVYFVEKVLEIIQRNIKYTIIHLN